MWKCGNVEMWRCGDVEMRRCGDVKMKSEMEQIPSPHSHSLII